MEHRRAVRYFFFLAAFFFVFFAVAFLAAFLRFAMSVTSFHSKIVQHGCTLSKEFLPLSTFLWSGSLAKWRPTTGSSDVSWRHS